MVFVTSWNEWNEDTGIQPVGGVPTSRDDSPSGTAYTQGYTYGGEGDVDLQVLRDFADVAWGRVLGASGRPVPHARVVETDQGRPVNSVLADAEGWYVLPRSGACPARMGAAAGGRAVPFTCSLSVARRVDLPA